MSRTESLDSLFIKQDCSQIPWLLIQVTSWWAFATSLSFIQNDQMFLNPSGEKAYTLVATPSPLKYHNSVQCVMNGFVLLYFYIYFPVFALELNCFKCESRARPSIRVRLATLSTAWRQSGTSPRSSHGHPVQLGLGLLRSSPVSSLRRQLCPAWGPLTWGPTHSLALSSSLPHRLDSAQSWGEHPSLHTVTPAPCPVPVWSHTGLRLLDDDVGLGEAVCLFSASGHSNAYFAPLHSPVSLLDKHYLCQLHPSPNYRADGFHF